MRLLNKYSNVHRKARNVVRKVERLFKEIERQMRCTEAISTQYTLEMIFNQLNDIKSYCGGFEKCLDELGDLIEKLEEQEEQEERECLR